MTGKKITAICLAVLLALSIAACGDRAPESGTTPGGEINTPTEPKDPETPAERLVTKAATDMVLGDDFKQSYIDDVFYNDRNDSVAYVTNAMWHMFGAIDDGQDLVGRIGSSATWYEWMTEKLWWSDDASDKAAVKKLIVESPQVDNGFLWSWTDRIEWRVGGLETLHYDGCFRYINAVYNVIKWENDVSFLDTVDNTRIGSDVNRDWSRGKTVRQKLDRVTEYILGPLKGSTGLIQITEDSLTMKNGQPMSTAWDNTAKLNSSSGNYWDNLCFGNYSAYEQALFYNALTALVGIERMCGNETKAREYETLRERAARAFDQTFWDETKGRYIGAVDTDGVRRDYGLTFLQFEALKYGLSDGEKGKTIFDWIDGKRLVAGDTSTGEDIMHFKIAARSNTVAIESEYILNEDGYQRGWWHGPDEGQGYGLGIINCFTNSTYGKHLENGGYIFYTAFYELMSRLRMQGADAAVKRLQAIADDYENNRRLNHDDGVPDWMEGLIGEYPENGLVPTAYLYGLLGIDASDAGLTVAPNFSTAYDKMGVKRILYGGVPYRVEVRRGGGLTMVGTGGFSLRLTYRPDGKPTQVRATLRSGTGTTLYSQTLTPDKDGNIALEFDANETARLEVTPL